MAANQVGSVQTLLLIFDDHIVPAPFAQRLFVAATMRSGRKAF